MEKPEEPQAQPVNTGAVKKKHEDKIRKKDPKYWENIKRSIVSMSDEDKATFLLEKYQKLYEEYRTLVIENQQLVRQNTVLQKDRDHTHAELAKNIIAKARLETLCRELQKQNKQIKEENFNKIKEEEEHRREVSNKFTDKLNDINSMMDENREKSEKLHAENLQMTSKLSELYTQFKQREDDITKMSKQLEIEREYSKTTMIKMELEVRAENEAHKQEVFELKTKLSKSEDTCAVLVSTAKNLQENLVVYKSQYDDFENTMSKSAKVFDNFKTEIANMSKQTTTLEKEAELWKGKFHEVMKALIDVTEAKRLEETRAKSMEKKNNQLQKLCRQLQHDRTFYLGSLKVNNIEPGPVPQLSEPVKTETSKLTKKEKQLLDLKDSLKVMQEELNKMTVLEPPSTSKKSKTEKQRRNSEVVVKSSESTPSTSSLPRESPHACLTLPNNAPCSPKGCDDTTTAESSTKNSIAELNLQGLSKEEAPPPPANSPVKDTKK